jgi:Gas vesicle protein G
MGLLKHLLFWPVTGPQFLIEFSLGKVNETVREQLTDDQSVKEDLLALQMQLELGEIDDDEYVAREAALMQRLREVREWREEFGMGTSGGPVRVRREAEPTPDLAEQVIASPDGTDDRVDEAPPRGGIASPEGASVEVSFDWE